MNKQLEKELQRIGGEVAKEVFKLILKKLKRIKYDKNVIVRLGKNPKKMKKK